MISLSPKSLLLSGISFTVGLLTVVALTSASSSAAHAKFTAQVGGAYCSGVTNRTQCVDQCGRQFPVNSSSRSSTSFSAPGNIQQGNLSLRYIIESTMSSVVRSGANIHFYPLSRPGSGNIYRPFGLLSLQNNASTPAHLTRFFYNANISGVSILHLPDHVAGTGYQRSPLKICDPDSYGQGSCYMTLSSGQCSDLRQTLIDSNRSCGYSAGAIHNSTTKYGVTTISVPASAFLTTTPSSPVRVTLGVDYHRNSGTTFTATTTVTTYYTTAGQGGQSGFFLCLGEPNAGGCTFYRFTL